MSAIRVVDVFAGPGGLNEGFSSLKDEFGNPIFETVTSIEMDPTAINTLRLRAALRTVRRRTGSTPGVYYDFLRNPVSTDVLRANPDFAIALKEAEEEVHPVELGETTRGHSDAILRRSLAGVGGDPWVLIGGPPCQAYSLAGRSRRAGDPNFADDHKHVLYREYLHILKTHRPAVFVMENVKGMLSSQHNGASIFDQILTDLSGAGYEIRSFVEPIEDPSPSDFIIRAERYGIPQKRHRVILLGVLKEARLPAHRVLDVMPKVTVRGAIGNMPRIRSMVSPRGHDHPDAFLSTRKFVRTQEGFTGRERADGLGSRYMQHPEAGTLTGEFGDWIADPAIGGVIQHESRSHMPSDLMRYAYLAFEASRGRRVKVNELPTWLLPNHRNASRSDAPFADRFRVQGWEDASTTVVSHISKDGHYYIHPDPDQMRSLTVREAARLQSFPDDYFFTGNRTQQYHQVGNAVPPLLARKLGGVVAQLLGRKLEGTKL